MSTPATSLAVGSQLAGYTITELLGQGEIGDLYLATTEAGTRVFLRLVSSSIVSDEEKLRDLERDLNKLEGLTHRNVSQVIGGGEEDQGFYYALDAPSTTSLFDLMYKCRTLYERELVWLGRGLTSGLAALHSAGLHHGGLTPNGVMVSHYGPIITDLGWVGRLGSSESKSFAFACKEDLQALRDTLVFAVTPRGGAPSLTDKVSKLLDGLLGGADTDAIADTWKEAADRLGLPDPMAPDTLKKLLERYENKKGPSDSSDDHSALATSQESPPLPPEPRPTGKVYSGVASVPLDDDSDVGGPALDESAETILPSAPTVVESSSSAVDAPNSEIITSEAAMSAVRFAKNMLAEFPVEPHSQELPAASIPKAKGKDKGKDKAKDKTVSTPSPPARSSSASSRKRRRRKKQGLDSSSGQPTLGKTAAKTAAKPAPKPRPPARKHSEEGLGPKLGAFGDFELLEELVAGRTSTIYKARRDDMDRTLAVKVMLPDTLRDKDLNRFLRAAESAQALQHPAIAKILSCGLQEKWTYVASKFISGRTLAEVCREDSDKAAEIPHTMLEVMRAVEYAHGHGIVHGDLKPENILIADDGTASVLEFGLPRVAAPGKTQAPPSPYASPETRKGAPVDEAADAYALGMILFEVATKGKFPHEIGGLTRLFAGSPPAPSAFSPDPIPWQIDAIVRKAIQPDPADRYPTVADMADDLQRCLMGQVRAPRGSALRRLRLWGYKRPLQLLTSFALLAAVCVGLGIGARALAEHITNPTGAVAVSPTLPSDGVPTETPPPTDAAPDPMKEREIAVLQAERDALRRTNQRLEQALSQARISGDRTVEERQQAAAEQAQRIAGLGRDLLDVDPVSAKLAFQEALRLSPGLREADEGLVEAELRASQESSTPDDPADEGPDPEGLNLLSEGREHLAAGRNVEARIALLGALTRGIADAAPLFGRVERALAREEQTEARKRERESAEMTARQRVEQARQYITRGALQEAWRAYLQALGLDPENKEAAAGLTEVAEQLHGSTEGSDSKAQLREAFAKSNEALVQGRQLFKQGEDPTEIYAAYLFALKSLDRAAVIAPQNERMLRERVEVAQELAAILREHGQTAFAELVLRTNGIKPSEVRQVRVPEDAYLEVEEADRVSIRRAFNGPVRFEPSDAAFAKLRQWIVDNGKQYRVRIQIKSRVSPGTPPAILATGLWISLEDKERKTRTPPRQIEFSGGPYKRLVRVTARGRLVLPFTRINTLSKDYVTEADALARRMVLEAQGIDPDD